MATTTRSDSKLRNRRSPGPERRRDCDREARERALDAHQKLLVKEVVFDGTSELRCTSCHQLHGLSHDKHSELPKQEFCFNCHEIDFSLKEYSQSCNVCEF